MPHHALPRTTPTAEGVAAAGVEAFLDGAASEALELHSLMVLRHGAVVAEGWWAPYERDGLHLLYSLSKSFTATAIGLAQAEGLVSTDDRVLPLLADAAPPDPHPYVAAWRVRDLLTMATGHREDLLPQLDPELPVQSVLASAPEEEPGTWFAYNNGATLLLSAVVQAVTGHRVLDYLGPRLLEPLGIDRANWLGHGDLDQGFSGLHLATEAVAKLGLLYLRGGIWGDRQLLPADWVAEATARQIDNPREPEIDWRQGYGYQFWRSRHGFRGDGAYGQFCLVLPEQDAVVVTTGATDRMQALLDLVWRHLLPALGGDDTGGDHRLAERLAGLSLAPTAGSRDRPASGPSPAPGGAAPSLRVSEIVESPDGWLLRLADPGTGAAVEVDCGYGTWRSTTLELPGGSRVDLAASAAWTGPTTLTADLLFVRTPHRLVLTLDEAAGAAMHWPTAPLGARSLADLALHPDRSWTPLVGE